MIQANTIEEQIRRMEWVVSEEAKGTSVSEALAAHAESSALKEQVDRIEAKLDKLIRSLSGTSTMVEI